LLKVLQISNKAPFPANDGSSIAIYNMAKGFLMNKVQLQLLTINTKKHYKPDEGVPADFRKKTNYKSVYKNTNTTLLGAVLNLFSGSSYFVSRFNFGSFRSALIQMLQTNEFDVIQLEGLFIGVYIDIIRKYSRAKIVLRAHNVEYLIWERHIENEKSVLKKFYLSLQTRRLKRFEETVWHKVDAIVSITDIDKLQIQKLLPQKPVFTCITGVDVDEYGNDGSATLKGNTIFSFSSMDWLPNREAVDWFLSNCWKQIHEAIPECKFVIAGRNMPQHLLKLSLPNVQVIEKVADSREFYSTYEIMLVPLLSGSGLRIKIIEGMAYGKAIVSTKIGAEGIEVQSGENILIADTAEDFSEAVISLLRDPDKRLKLERAARKFAEEEFDNEKVVAKLVVFYEQLHV
jgi:polysaccharide biosynthesis protein PslH